MGWVIRIRRAVVAAALLLPAACASHSDVRANVDGSFVIASAVRPGHARGADRAAEKSARRYCEAFGQRVEVIDRAEGDARSPASLHFRCVWPAGQDPPRRPRARRS